MVDASPTQLDVKSIKVCYDKTPALENVSLVCEPGTATAVMGGNGAGKSTLLKAVAGLLPLKEGTIAYGHSSIRNASKLVAYLPQREAIDWDFPLTVRGVVELGRYAHVGLLGRFGSADRDAVEAALAVMDMKELEQRHIHALSGGQQQRMLLARALAQEAGVLLLDEPFTGLDKPASEQLERCMRNLTARGHILLVSHHDLRTAPHLFDRILLLKRSSVAYGDPSAVLTPANLEQAYDT